MRAWYVYLCLILCADTLADELFPTREQEDESFSVQFGIFQQTDGADDLGGNPHIDEEETVYEAIIVLDKKLTDTDSIQYRFLGDLVSSASVTRETNPMFQVLQSHPSGSERGEIGVAWDRDEGKSKIGVNGSFSAESSLFFSLGFGLNFGRTLAGENASLRLGYQGYYDTFQYKRYDGVVDDYENRHTHTLDIGLTQIISPSSIFDVSLSHTLQTGFLSGTWHSVFVNGVEVSEVAPARRTRNALTLRFKQGIKENNSFELAYRAYDDTWGLQSHTWEISFSQYLNNKSILLEPRYRYYDQKPAFFFDRTFNQSHAFMSSDPDLGDFKGRSAGITGSLFGTSKLGRHKADVSLSMDYYQRSDGVDLFWTTLGYKTRF